MTYARPELLASTEWLADNMGRPELRILDVRWRPDGSAREVHARGHIPGAAHVDWASDLVEPDEASGVPLLAGP
jgi:thiosulfate/3-mercaptopyruvate sulfurtransferase